MDFIIFKHLTLALGGASGDRKCSIADLLAGLLVPSVGRRLQSKFLFNATFVDERGHRLRDGLHQRTSLAYAILPSPDLPILDEDTSTFNPLKDQLFQHALEYILSSKHWAPR